MNSDLPIMKPTIERKKANSQKWLTNAETKWRRLHRNPQTKRGSFRPNLSEMGLTTRLPTKKPAKITDVDTNPSDPRSHTRSNCGKRKDLWCEVYFITVGIIVPSGFLDEYAHAPSLFYKVCEGQRSCWLVRYDMCLKLIWQSRGSNDQINILWKGNICNSHIWSNLSKTRASAPIHQGFQTPGNR